MKIVLYLRDLLLMMQLWRVLKGEMLHEVLLPVIIVMLLASKQVPKLTNFLDGFSILQNCVERDVKLIDIFVGRVWMKILKITCFRFLCG